MKSITEVDLNAVMNEERLVLMEFHSPNCAHCRALAPVLESLEQKYADQLELISVDIFESDAAAAKYNVMSVPTLVFFKQGQLKDKIIGNTYEAILEEKIKRFS